jgi:hypothetical protein
MIGCRLLRDSRTLFAATMLSLSAATGAASAEKAEVDANGGMQIIFTFVSTYADTCDSADPPRYKIKKQTANGQLVADIVKTTYPADDEKCASKPVQVFVVGYQPNRGFRGKDSGTVSMSYTLYTNESVRRSRDLRFDITVK